MADKSSKPPAVGLKPVPMKLFATWEVDRTPPNCIPRLCSLTLSRLVVLKALGPDLASITIAVKMQGSKRTLRSNEMLLPPNGLLDTELQLNFSLQYPHFLKQDGNKLHIMLQRRKRYKNRTILGYKTLAEGVINMSQVLQRQMDLELELLSGDAGKEGKGGGGGVVGGGARGAVARVTVLALNSQPVDHEDPKHHHRHSGRGVADFSDEDEEFSSGEEAEGSDSEPMLEERRPSRKAKGLPANARQQRNLKQKFISLLKRFRVSEDLQGLETERVTIARNISGTDMDPADIEDLIDELEDLSDSGPELDTMSITSTPKPSLRPFFSSSRSLLLHDSLNVPGRPHNSLPPARPNAATVRTEKPPERLSDESSKRADSDSHPDNWTDSDPPPPIPPTSSHASQASSPPKPTGPTADEKKDNMERERKSRLFARDRNSTSSMGKSEKKKAEKTCSGGGGGILSPSQAQADSAIAEPRKVVLDQLSRVLPAADDSVPSELAVVSGGEAAGPQLAARLHDRGHKAVCAATGADVRATIACLVNKIQKFCNSNPKPPAQMKLLLAGSDSFVNCVLRHYVDQLSSKPPDWQTYIRFLVVPLGNNTLCRYLGSLDGVYYAAFASDSWKELCERGDTAEMAARVQRYVQMSGNTVNLPIAEAMLTYKEKSSDDDSSQIFIPFMNDVRLGSPENSATTSMDLEDQGQGVGGGAGTPLLPLSGSPPSSLTILPSSKVTPPSSPNIGQSRELCEPLELQLDYWLLSGRGGDAKGDTGGGGGGGGGGGAGEKKKGDSAAKSTLKSTFRSLQVARLPAPGDQPSPHHFTISYATKEKKQKIMRLGKKKEKEKENEAKSQYVEGVSRLIVSPKAQNIPLKLCIDGTEWSGVKFFQLSAQWQTHTRHFPVALFAQDNAQP